jgi:hypothetical protein
MASVDGYKYMTPRGYGENELTIHIPAYSLQLSEDGSAFRIEGGGSLISTAAELAFKRRETVVDGKKLDFDARMKLADKSARQKIQVSKDFVEALELKLKEKEELKAKMEAKQQEIDAFIQSSGLFR